MASAIEQAARVQDHAAAFTEASLGFHLAVAEASHNRALFALLRALRYVVWGETKRATTEVAGRVLQAHRSIYAKIEAGDSAGAREAMSRHLGGIRESKNRQPDDVLC
jgi:GntR family transcriptional repressor for pyruvate dehydrogenase complex